MFNYLLIWYPVTVFYLQKKQSWKWNKTINWPRIKQRFHMYKASDKIYIYVCLDVLIHTHTHTHELVDEYAHEYQAQVCVCVKTSQAVKNVHNTLIKNELQQQ